MIEVLQDMPMLRCYNVTNMLHENASAFKTKRLGVLLRTPKRFQKRCIKVWFVPRCVGFAFPPSSGNPCG